MFLHSAANSGRRQLAAFSVRIGAAEANSHRDGKPEMEIGMDDLYAINAAKSEFREGFNLGDASRVLAIADPDLVNFSDGQLSEFGGSGLDAFKSRLENLFDRCTAKLTVIVIEIRVQGDVAYDYGWHELMLAPKDGGQRVHRRDRYVDIWRRNKEGQWKLWMYMDNQDIADPFGSEQIPSVGVRAHGSS
jgi:ketosteroid isomerase-like protein